VGEISLKAIPAHLRVFGATLAHTKNTRGRQSNAYGLGAGNFQTRRRPGRNGSASPGANEGIGASRAGIRKRILVLTGSGPARKKTADTETLTPTVSAWTTAAFERAQIHARQITWKIFSACLST